MMRLLVIAIAVTLLVWALRKRMRRTRAAREAKRGARRALLESLPLWQRVPPALRHSLADRVDDFIHRIPFTGAGSFVVDEPMRVQIAATACLVTLGHDGWPFGVLHGITVHPDEFIVRQEIEDEETGIVTEGYEALSGQSIETDRIVLSWRDVQESDARNDGYNVVIHEITHFLDYAHPGGDAAARAALESARTELCRALDRGESTLIDPYGAEDITEFLAVSAEAFFEQPHELRDRHPTLYVLLRESFKLDPATWPGTAQ